MKVQLGDRSQFYGEDSDPARAGQVQRIVLRALEQAGLKLTGVYTGMRGEDVWFEIADAAVPQLEAFVATLPEVGTPSHETGGEHGDGEDGKYLYLPLVFEKRVQRRRR